MMHFQFLIALALASKCVLFAAAAEPARVAPLPRAHAHNDYLHPHPLSDALALGFCSVEADIHLVEGKLLVAHDLRDVQPERTLQSLYLNPLLERVQAHDGWVFDEGQRFTLLVDIKSKGGPTYDALSEVLAGYREMLSSVHSGHVQQRAVDLIISGDRPIAKIASAKHRYVFVDGRLSDLNEQAPAHLIPLVSDNWSKAFAWRGEGPMPAAEREKLRDIVQQARGQGRRLRFWATPDKPAFWSELDRAGVDLIGTDDLISLQQFLTK